MVKDDEYAKKINANKFSALFYETVGPVLIGLAKALSVFGKVLDIIVGAA